METATLLIQGMECEACARAVTQALSGLDGVQSSQVSLEDGRAVVTFDPAKTDLRQMLDAVTEAGYDSA